MNSSSFWRILLIDDDQDDYVLTKKMLRASEVQQIALDWRATYAAGMQAIRSGEHFDAALVDYDLGCASGIDFIREANQAGCTVPLILYTGRGSHEVDMEAMEVGATLYLTKAEANPLLLTRIIRYAIERKQSELSLRRASSELEQRVAERTAALHQANAQLRAEIAERQAAQQALSERENILAQTLDSLPVGVWLIDRHGNIRQGNKAGLRVWGGAHYVGPAGYQVYNGWRTDTGQPLAPEDWPALRVLASGQPLEEELEIEAFDGQHKIIWISAVPLLDEHNQTSGVIVVNQDISERKQAEQTLYNQHQILETVYNSLYLALALLDRDLSFVRVNRTFASLDGHDEAFFIGKKHFDLYPSPENEAIFRHVIESGQPYQALARPYLNTNHPERGSTYWDWSLQPMRDQHGQVSGVLLALLDVTERVQSDQALAEANASLEMRVKERTAEVQRYAERLAASNKELENFAIVASHDLQEPLRKIEAFGKRLRERLANKLDTGDSDYLERLLSAAQRMREMIDGLLSLSRVSIIAGHHQAVDMGQIARQVVEDLEVRIRQCQAQVLLGPLPSVQADKLQMEQLLMNLISNGLKFHREGVPPQVKLYGRLLPDGQAEIVIEDNGIGIDAQYIPRLFQPFQRLHEHGRFDGSGMGLAICRKIVERHGGSIALESQPGQGSQVIIKLKAEN